MTDFDTSALEMFAELIVVVDCLFDRVHAPTPNRLHLILTSGDGRDGARRAIAWQHQLLLQQKQVFEVIDGFVDVGTRALMVIDPVWFGIIALAVAVAALVAIWETFHVEIMGFLDDLNANTGVIEFFKQSWQSVSDNFNSELLPALEQLAGQSQFRHFNCFAEAYV